MPNGYVKVSAQACRLCEEALSALRLAPAPSAAATSGGSIFKAREKRQITVPQSPTYLRDMGEVLPLQAEGRLDSDLPIF